MCHGLGWHFLCRARVSGQGVFEVFWEGNGFARLLAVVEVY